MARPKVTRSYSRRSPDERLRELEKKLEALKAKQIAREKKDDPVLREIQQLLKRLKRFIQLAHDHRRPDVANSAMGFKSLLERIVHDELDAPVRAEGAAADDAP